MDARDHLIIRDSRNKIMDYLDRYQLIIVTGPTRSGKSSQLPQYALAAGYGEEGIIIASEPRRLPATTLSSFVSSECDTECGGLVGHIIRYDNNTSAETKIVFVTEGILLKMLVDNPYLDGVKVLIVDEIHEDGVNLHLILAILLKRRPDLKVILTSATIDAEKHSRYFSNAPIITIEGDCDNVETIYEPLAPNQKYTEAAAQLVGRIHQSGRKGDILVFLPGEADIFATMEMVQNMDLDMVLFPLYAQLPPREQAKAFLQYDLQKIIFGTNMGETSITIPQTSTVVDSALIKQSGFNPRTGVKILELVKAPLASLIQRRGRAARDMEHGYYHVLASKEDVESRPMYATSEILRTDLTDASLFMRVMGYDIADYTMFAKPETAYCQAADKRQFALGAISSNKIVTPAGYKMNKMPFDAYLGKQVLTGIERGCGEAVTIIAAMTSEGRRPFFWPMSDEWAQAQADIAKSRFIVPESDHLTYLKLYTKWLAQGGEDLADEWYEENYINKSVLVNAKQIVEQVKMIMEESYVRGSADPIAIRKSIASGLTDHVCKRIDQSHYLHLYSGETVTLHASSDLYDQAEFMVADELLSNHKEGGIIKACLCTAIEPEWIGLQPAKHERRSGRAFSRAMSIAHTTLY